MLKWCVRFFIFFSPIYSRLAQLVILCSSPGFSLSITRFQFKWYLCVGCSSCCSAERQLTPGIWGVYKSSWWKHHPPLLKVAAALTGSCSFLCINLSCKDWNFCWHIMKVALRQKIHSQSYVSQEWFHVFQPQEHCLRNTAADDYWELFCF